MGILKVENNYLVKGNQFGRQCDHETEMLILTMYLKKIFESIKYFTNVFDPMPGKFKSSLVHQNI